MNKPIYPFFRTALSAALTFQFLTGCGGGNGSGLMSPPPNAALEATFSSIQTNVFTPTCAISGCHTGAGAPQGLRLDAANSFALLVGVASSQVPAILRVSPGDPTNSYLIRKLEGTAASGAQMPLGGAPLPQDTIDVLRQWITDGAIDDRAPATNPLRVTSLSPLPASTLDTAPNQILAVFDRNPDASTVNANTFILEASGGDQTFGDGNEVQINAASITVPAANPGNAIFDLQGVVLSDDTYRVRILGSGPSLVLDLDANALDGEFSGTFPSGDGSEGGDFEAEFSVMAPTVPAVTLDQIQSTVFTPTCAIFGCHTGPTSTVLPAGMDLTDADASFAALVGIASIEVPAIARVTAGDPDNSYLIQKLEGTAAVGGRMPLGGAALDAAVIADIRQWIEDGAVR